MFGKLMKVQWQDIPNTEAQFLVFNLLCFKCMKLATFRFAK